MSLAINRRQGRDICKTEMANKKRKGDNVVLTLNNKESKFRNKGSDDYLAI